MVNKVVEDIVEATGVKTLVAQKNGHGVDVVPAETSAWKFAFALGMTPTEDELRVKLGALGAVRVMQAGYTIFSDFDGSVDPDVINIVDTSKRSVIDREARLACVNNADTAEKFDSAVNIEVSRITENLRGELDSVKSELANALSENSMIDYSAHVVDAATDDNSNDVAEKA